MADRGDLVERGAEMVVGGWRPGQSGEGTVGSNETVVERSVESGAAYGVTVNSRDASPAQTGGGRAKRHMYAPAAVWRERQRRLRPGEKVWGKDAWASRPASL